MKHERDCMRYADFEKRIKAKENLSAFRIDKIKIRNGTFTFKLHLYKKIMK